MSGWFGGFGFVFVFFNAKGSDVDVFSHVLCFVLCFFMDFWSLEVTFSEILVSLGRLWTCLVPGGSREAMLAK